MKKEEISRKFLVMSERKRTYDIGNFEGKRGQCPRVQDLPGPRASMTDTIVEDDDNNLEEAQPGSSQQQYTKTRRNIGEIEEISSEFHIKSERKRNYEMGKFEGKRVQSSTVQDLPGTTASMSDVIVKNVDNQLEKAQPGSVQEGKIEEVESFRAESSQMNALSGTGPSTFDIVLRSYNKEQVEYTKEQVESIITELELIEAFLEDVKAIEEPDSKLKFWEKQMRHIAEEAKNIIRIYGRKRSILKHLYLDNKIVWEISMIKKKIQEITERRIAFGILHVEASDSTQRRYLPSQYSEESVFIGFNIFHLNEPRHCVILIAGMECFGKTTLAESIFKDNSIHFPTNAWVSISSKEPPAEEILQDILEQVKALQELKGQQSIKDELKQMLRNFLREKTYLIVLDNLHMSRVWDDLKDAFPDEPNGSRIVITTRDMAIPLDADSRIVQYKLQLPLEIENKGRLPLKEVVTDEEWSEISKIVISELPLELKRCLHYFLLFPEKFDIPKRRLTTLWVAEGFLRRGRDGESPEDFAERCLMELIDRELVQVTKKKPNGKVRTCRLPGALRGLLSKDNIASDRHSFNHIYGDNTDTSALQVSYKQSLSFLFFDKREGSQPGEEIGNILHRCISCGCLLFLRVLDLERVFRPQLPKVLSKLDLLRYLGLRWTYLESLPSSISNLLKLQTLDVKHTYISTLPCSIWKMQRLRHLYLSESYRSRFEPRPSAASLTDLQTLWGAFVDEKSPVKGGLDTLVNLRKLGVACRCMSNQKDEMTLQLKAVADWIEKLVHLQSLRLKSHDENNQPWDLHLNSLLGHKNLSSVYFLGKIKTPSVISEFPVNLIELTLSASELTEAYDPMKKLANLPELRILQLFSESYVGESMCCPKDSFPQLRVLKLWKLKELKKWTVQEGALSQLRDLEIRSCARLEKLPDGLQHVKTLQELKLSNMPREFTERIKDGNSEDWGKIEHVRLVIIEP